MRIHGKIRFLFSFVYIVENPGSLFWRQEQLKTWKIIENETKENLNISLYGITQDSSSRIVQ